MNDVEQSIMGHISDVAAGSHYFLDVLSNIGGYYDNSPNWTLLDPTGKSVFGPTSMSYYYPYGGGRLYD